MISRVALKAFQNLTDFREDSQFPTWLIRITVNQSLMKLRKQRAQKEVPLDEDLRRTRRCCLWTSQIEPRIPNNSAGHLNCETFSSEP
jgi:DNA-directed RNA polymerase specialized sigma24 family protein